MHVIAIMMKCIIEEFLIRHNSLRRILFSDRLLVTTERINHKNFAERIFYKKSLKFYYEYSRIFKKCPNISF